MAEHTASQPRPGTRPRRQSNAGQPDRRQHQPVSPRREAEMLLAIELEVDGDDFSLRGAAEQRLWDELVAEFEHRVARQGRQWTAELLG